MTRVFRSIFTVAAVVSAAFLATTALAEAEYYACQIKKDDQFFPSEMVFAIDADQGAAMVVDQMIYYYNDGRGIEAEISEMTGKKMVFTWDLPMTNRSGQNTVMRFRGVLQRPSMRLLVSAKPHGYRSHFTGRGVCQATEVEIEGL